MASSPRTGRYRGSMALVIGSALIVGVGIAIVAGVDLIGTASAS